MFQGLWILLYLLEAKQVSIFVEFVKGVADAPTWWSQDIFTMHTEGVGALLNYALPAVIYLPAGQEQPHEFTAVHPVASIRTCEETKAVQQQF
ncbi:hypothetical protein [Streptomyces sp. NEAU-S7GS2]|uniref:hypothetical protein n=1 Tax=Streptomyces sp. NEAU-S7GS2 TaxID=2202000 RepID=UPI0026A227A1